MVIAKDVQGVMAMMPSFLCGDAGDLKATATVAVDNTLQRDRQYD